MELVSEQYDELFIPYTARVVLVEQDVDSITLNTDLKCYVSSDGGSTWDQVTLVEKPTVTADQRLLVGMVTLTGADSQLLWKVTTHNTKQLYISGVGVLWK